MTATVKTIVLGNCPRIIAISDIHGNLPVFTALLMQIGYRPGVDALVLLGDLYLKGPQPRQTLDYIMKLSETPHVHILKGNCDYPGDDWHTPAHAAWLGALPVILDSEDFTFVHAGLTSTDIRAQAERTCVKNDNFMEQGLRFDNWLLTGHWPVNNYCHGIPGCNPIVNEAQKIIAIDGGNVINAYGQINAFIIEDSRFSFQSADALESFAAPHDQAASGGLNITWLDRWVEVLKREEGRVRVRHLATGTQLWLPEDRVWQEADGRTAATGTDYCLPVRAGEGLKVAVRYADRLLCKKDGLVGWYSL